MGRGSLGHRGRGSIPLVYRGSLETAFLNLCVPETGLTQRWGRGQGSSHWLATRETTSVQLVHVVTLVETKEQMGHCFHLLQFPRAAATCRCGSFSVFCWRERTRSVLSHTHFHHKEARWVFRFEFQREQHCRPDHRVVIITMTCQLCKKPHSVKWEYIGWIIEAEQRLKKNNEKNKSVIVKMKLFEFSISKVIFYSNSHSHLNWIVFSCLAF